MIANSGHDERGKYSGGKAGDQTGHEWEIRTWYNRPWDCILRHPDPRVGKLIAELARRAANNNNIGYNQAKRLTFWQNLEKVGYDPAKITTKCDSDCSAGVSAIAKAAGFIIGDAKLKNISPSNWTGSMRASFKDAGFQVITNINYLLSDNYLIPGDILLNTQHHVCINLDYGKNAQKSSVSIPELEPIEPANISKSSTTAASTGQINEIKSTTTVNKTGKAYSKALPKVPPVLKKGSKGLQVKNLQNFLNWYGGYQLVVDGDFGGATDKAVKDFQKKTGLSVDGQFGPASLNMAKSIKK